MPLTATSDYLPPPACEPRGGSSPLIRIRLVGVIDEDQDRSVALDRRATPFAPVLHEGLAGEPAEDGKPDRHRIRPAPVVRERDFDQEDAHRRTDERADHTGNHSHRVKR
jgi:hypothetical protein